MNFPEAAAKLVAALNEIEAGYPGFYAGPEAGTFYLYDPNHVLEVQNWPGPGTRTATGCVAGEITRDDNGTWHHELWYEYGEAP